jgi:hypothetical protein
MAYPNGIGPTGLVPDNLIGGRVYSGAIRQIPIDSGYAQNIGFGDFVTYTSDGTIVRVDTTAATTYSAFAEPPVGIFLGCSYVSSTGMKYFTPAQYWPAGTTILQDNENYGYGWAYVCEDPDAVFVATVTNAGTLYTSGAATQAAVGQNIGYHTGTALVNTTTGNSETSLDLTTLSTTATLPLRVVDIVRSTALPDGTYQQLLVTWNFGKHFYRQTTGI